MSVSVLEREFEAFTKDMPEDAKAFAACLFAMQLAFSFCDLYTKVLEDLKNEKLSRSGEAPV